MTAKDLDSLRPGDKVRFKAGTDNSGMTATVVSCNANRSMDEACIQITGCGPDRWVHHSRVTKVKS